MMIFHLYNHTVKHLSEDYSIRNLKDILETIFHYTLKKLLHICVIKTVWEQDTKDAFIQFSECQCLKH